MSVNMKRDRRGTLGGSVKRAMVGSERGKSHPTNLANLSLIRRRVS